MSNTLRTKICTAAVTCALTAFCGVRVSAAVIQAPAAYSDMVARFKKIHTYQATIQESTLLQPTTPGAQARTITSTDLVVYQSPNLFSLVNNGLMGGVTVVSDGKKEYLYSSLTEQYATRAAPTDVLSSFIAGQRGTKVQWGRALLTKFDNVPVEELTGTSSTPRGNVVVTLDIKKSDSLPLRVVITLPTVSASTGDGLRITRTEIFTGQKLNVSVPAATFKFAPPAGSTKADSPSDLGGGFGGPGLGQ